MNQYDWEPLARALFEGFGDGLLLAVPGSDRLLDANPVAERLCGVSRAELLATPLTQLFRCAGAEGMAVLCPEPELAPTRAFAAPAGWPEGCFLRAAGDCWIPVHLTLARLPFGSQTFHLLTVRDLREQRAVQERLRRAEEELRHVLASVSDALWSAEVDPAGQWVCRYLSPVVEKITGYPAQIFHGGREEWRQVVYVEDQPRWDAALRRMLVGESSQEEYRIVRADGGLCWVRESVNATPAASPGHLRLDGVLTDITGWKHLHEQLLQARKMEAVGQLAGGVAHDFNNLLTVISGYSDLLLRQLEPQSRPWEAVREVRRASERATELTRQLLTFSRQLPGFPVVLDLNEMLGSMETLLRRLVGTTIELVLERAPDLGRVKADRNQVEQVVFNLVINARDAMPKRGQVTVATFNATVGPAGGPGGAPPGQYVVLAVRDTGVGMDAATQARIFEPFFTTKEFGKGTGLGLAVVYGVVQQAGGHVGVQTALGKGTVFEVYLPRTEGTAARRRSVTEMEAPPCGFETVLVAEDEAPVRALAREALEACGYQVLEAAGAEDALRVFRQHSGPIHLLLTDVILQGTSGSKLAELLSLLCPSLKILYVSGHPQRVLDEYGVSVGRVPLLRKPFTASQLSQKVRVVLDS